MKISIENPAGTYREGKDPDGHKWKTKIYFDYGYIRGTVGKDKDHVDCFIGKNKDSKQVYIIHQKDIKTGRYDEDKVMLGWDNKKTAIKDYLKNYDRKDMFMGCTAMSIEKFKKKAFSANYKGRMIKNILGKSQVKAHLRRTKSGKLVHVREHTDRRTKKFKTRKDVVYDVGEKIGGAKKDLYHALYARRITPQELKAMESDHAAVVKSVVKNNVIEPINPEEAMNRGWDAGLYYYYRAMKRAICNNPPDNPEIRKDYIIVANRLNRVMKTAKDRNDLAKFFWEESLLILGNKEQARKNALIYLRKKLGSKGRQKTAKKIIDELKSRNERDGGLSWVDREVLHFLKLIMSRVDALSNPESDHRKWASNPPPLMSVERAFIKALNEQMNVVNIKGARAKKLIPDMTVFDKDGKWLSFLTISNRAVPPSDGRIPSLIYVKDTYNKASNMRRGMMNVTWDQYIVGAKNTNVKRGGFYRDVPKKPKRKGGRKVSFSKPEDFMKEFGVRGVEFGNYIDRGSGAYHIRQCGQALYDLMDILKFKPKDMSLNKRLALAFGARGTGNAKAHYEPLNKTINMTKYNGGGSLAHEWGHFLDNVLSLGTKDGGLLARMYASEGAKIDKAIKKQYDELVKAMTVAPKERTVKETLRAIPKTRGRSPLYIGVYQACRAHPNNPGKAFEAAKKTIIERGYGYWLNDVSNLKKLAVSIATRLKQGFDYKITYKTSKTKFYSESLRLGADYWGSGREMFARAFESYIEDELSKSSRMNTYLVSGTKSSRYVKYVKGEQIIVNPYPEGKEREVINRKIKSLIVALRKNKRLLKSLMVMFL